MIAAAGGLRTLTASLSQHCVLGECNYTHTGRHNHRKQPADWLRRPPQLLTSDTENAVEVTRAITFIRRPQSTTGLKMKHDVTFGGQCVIEIHWITAVCCQGYSCPSYYIWGAGSSASWQPLIQIWIMYDDEYNASVEWCIEIGTQGRCMWVSMGVCVQEREKERGRDTIGHHNHEPTEHTVTPTSTQQNTNLSI